MTGAMFLLFSFILSSDSSLNRAYFTGGEDAFHTLQTSTTKDVYTMYHGTTVDRARLIIANGFRQSEDGMLGRGVYVSRDMEKAACYPLGCDDCDRVILKLSVRFGRVKRIDSKNHPLQKSWNAHGYNTAWVPPNSGWVPSGREEDCVFNPKRVKVIGIAQAPNPGVQWSFERLITDQTPHRPVTNALQYNSSVLIEQVFEPFR